jgi:hypothetical protein
VTATIHPFPRLTGDYEPRTPALDHHSLSLRQGPLQGRLDGEVLRQTRHLVVDCWAIRAESRRIKRRYEERQRRIEVLLAGMDGVERV